ncbi:hypothetical protein ANME2D_01472 [Candidatus Methanoperedens nitroreducens]|uniref:DUF473 domain-containing protein n=1 Tax=Candidatus Methanoperedens nitratireducens TaxID=1392998 RepID=A0A062V9N8_9EURY|nr:DUF473 domain-containing protein [Candidatus Methanoperedens nitroreducens]KCZ72070.1 hypothetical protein ANME2D_01472 [Candidatus Methanoperedens nitroreducens]MDJ1421955.1 DUF473 domain-containing protein [Candidatus Methanoperedens sp.]
MQYIVFSGISQHVLKSLEQDKIKTIEIRSPHNFLSALETDIGDVVFLTSTSLGDIRPGITGIIAKIREKQISMHRMVQRTEDFYEEAEVQMARLQLELKGYARVRRAICCAIGEAAIVDADQMLFFEGR